MSTTDIRTPYTVGHRTVSRVAGPLIIVDGMERVGYGELVDVETGDGTVREGQVLELDGSRAVIQVFGGTVGIGRRDTSVLSRGRAARTGVGPDFFGRVLNGAGRPLDGGPEPVPDAYRHVNGLPLNPLTRAHPDQFIETGVSAIDGLTTLVRGQKLPIFSGAGLPANDLAARIAAQARVPGDDAEVAVIFAAIGVTRREAEFFRTEFLTGGAAARSVLLLNLADDPTIERLLTPRVALTMAEYLAFEQGRARPRPDDRHDRVLRGPTGDLRRA